MKRRSFIKHLSHAMAVPGVVGSMGFKMPGAHSLTSLLRLAGETDRVLVLIYLDGGNDGLNTVIPLDQLSTLNSVRSHVVLPDKDIISIGESDLGFHPSLTDFASLFAEDRLQVVQNVGYPDQNYSHFRSTDIWMSGSDSNQFVNSGWGGRFLQETFPGYPADFPNVDMPDPLAVEIGHGGSLLFQGPQEAMSMVISDPSFFYQLIDNEEEEAPNTPAGEKLRYIRLIERQSQEYGKTVKAAAEKATNSIAYPATFLGEQLKIVSRLIAGGLKTPIYMVRLGGFDTHDEQVDKSDHSQGEHAELLKELNDAVMAFMKDTEELGIGDRVLGMTFSEFGRRIVSNASLGTDHGASAPMFFFGNKVRGGVTGTNPNIPSNATYDTNLPYEVDFRQLYSSVLEQWFETSDEIRETTTMKSFETIPIIGEREKVLSTSKEVNKLMVYPNPVGAFAKIRLSNINMQTEIVLLDLKGSLVEKVFSGVPENHEINWSSGSLRSGQYLIVSHSAKGREVFKIVKI